MKPSYTTRKQLGRKPCIPLLRRRSRRLSLLASQHPQHGSGHALSGDLIIFSDMSNPAPRAVMEGMVARFGAMHPDLNIELTVVDREA